MKTINYSYSRNIKKTTQVNLNRNFSVYLVLEIFLI